MQIKDQVAFVTGAGQGIGRAAALKLAEAGATVVAVDINPKTAEDTASAVARGAIGKGDVLAVARVAGIQAAKRAPDLIPLCHPLLIGAVLVNFRIEEDYIEVEAEVETIDRTGVEMEALTAASVAALTIYDMCKSRDRGMTITDVCLWEKTGGRSGTYRRANSDDATHEL